MTAPTTPPSFNDKGSDKGPAPDTRKHRRLELQGGNALEDRHALKNPCIQVGCAQLHRVLEVPDLKDQLQVRLLRPVRDRTVQKTRRLRAILPDPVLIMDQPPAGRK
ncbi:hypothetical protein [Tateyamaria sp. SN6-1]|uniref:hypothetical protein n=1 Tax=Tateyamaria sp. SN6-1 TaxID=3092148 RepID=UPI0039F4F88F